jgi:hypothetical protein
MQPEREPLVDVILEPAPLSDLPGAQPSGPRSAGEQPVAPGAPGTVYCGPERRAQGYLVAEIVPDPAPLDGRTAGIDRSR